MTKTLKEGYTTKKTPFMGMKRKGITAPIFAFLFLFTYPVSAQDKMGIYVHQIAIHPKKPRIIYVVTDDQGVLKSTDAGKTWALANQGIKAYLLYDILIHPKTPDTLYVGSWGGGIYKSADAGASWIERNTGLEDTAIWTMALVPHDKETLYVATSAGVRKGIHGGESWSSISRDLRLGDEELPQCLILQSSKPTILYLGTNQGIYQWNENDTKWSKINGDHPWNVTALGYDPRTGYLYVGVAGEGVYRRDVSGQTWKLIADLKGTWAHRIILHPTRPDTFYALTQARGILKMVVGSKTWIDINGGIKDPWVTTLIFDPKNPEILYAGTHEHGIFKTVDGGKAWASLLEFEIQDAQARGEALLPKMDLTKKSTIPPAPPVFKKCNECHGWTDPILNSRPSTHWRMAGNRRDWTGAVKRMSRRGQLLPDEEAEIIKYLNTYYGINK